LREVSRRHMRTGAGSGPVTRLGGLRLARDDPVDLLVIGGGVNGTGIARDAVGRGLSVLLCEQHDLASHTSSASSKLIHGGLRYLEHYEFRLVREALIEREVLLRAAPHIIWPLRFVLPYEPRMRPAWLIRLGLFLYDRLGGRERLSGSRAVDLRHDPAGAPLKNIYRKAFAYADCWVEDARLVVLNAIDAAERGAEILTRHRCSAVQRAGGLWHATLRPTGGGPERVIRARCLINATGPWVSSFLTESLHLPALKRVRLVKGSHIVVRKLYDHDAPYILQHTDRRVIFVIPYEQDYTLIGTTDLDFDGDPAEVAIADSEIAYLCQAVSRYFVHPVTPSQLSWSYSGVRPLHDDSTSDVSAVTRDYVFDLAQPDGMAPLLSVFGGKITTYRRLAEHALDKLRPVLGLMAGAWTAKAPLPGGDMPNADFDAFLLTVLRAHPWLPVDLARRYARAYGTRIERVLDGAQDLAALGEHLGDGVYEAEVDYLVHNEWARTEEDILWRRSKLGLHVSAETAARLRGWLSQNSELASVGVEA
jgi:glycerol-3-phosphate dehydrogenase